MTAIFLDVGQGDAALVALPSGKHLLIDGGPREAGEKVVQALRRQGVRQVDLVIASHPHEDHIGGLVEVLGAFVVRAFGESGYLHPTQTYERLLREVAKRQIPARLLHAGQRIGDPLVDIEVLAPPAEGLGDGGVNNHSIVVRIAFGRRAFLFPGDMEREERRWLLAQGVEVRADVLKVAHHGSADGTDAAFLRAVRPQVAIISCGAGNDYGHPHPSTLRLLNSFGVEVHRTDREGDIVVRTDGQRLFVE